MEIFSKMIAASRIVLLQIIVVNFFRLVFQISKLAEVIDSRLMLVANFIVEMGSSRVYLIESKIVHC